MKADFLKQYDENKRDEETTENTKKLIEHAPEYVEQAKNFFQQHFIWLPGEYTIVVNIQTDQDSSNISKAFNFILFETQSDQLKKITEEYKYGGGIWWDPENVPMETILVITEV